MRSLVMQFKIHLSLALPLLVLGSCAADQVSVDEESVTTAANPTPPPMSST